QLYPRAAYYALKQAHRFNPYTEDASSTSLDRHFASIQLMDAVLQARGDKAALEGESSKKVQLSRLSAELTSFNTGGSLISTPEADDPTDNMFPNQQGFDHMQSFFVGVQAQPNPSLRANVEFNILGNVAQNPINEVFYENRGRPITTNTTNGLVTQGDANRVALYRADISWNHEKFDMNAFYRTGHYHWGYEGDFFNLYPEANYGPNIDIYNGNAPLGVEFEGKKELKGLTLAMGPELWWGANPAVLLKYTREFKGMEVTGIFHEDLEERGQSESSFAIPQPRTRRATLQMEKEMGHFGLQLGGLWGGQPLNGRTFQLVSGEEGDDAVYQDKIDAMDNWGGKVKMTYSKGKINWYAQAAAMGLVAGGGADPTLTFTGWRLKDSGSGNQYNFLTGFTYLMGDLQIAPNFLWQRPIEGPIPGDIGAPGRPRNILTDPFVVRGNRETVAGEILLTYDPTPATYMYQWDNDQMEDAKFAMSAGFVFRHLPTTQDAAIGILPDGRTFFAFPGAAPAQDLWEAHARIVSKISPELGMVANIYTGTAQANGSDPRKIQRFGTDLRAIYKRMKLVGAVKVNDWGPFDYHRDFNLTFPLQLQLDLSTSLGT
ncbi:MAG: glycosidase, partial [Bacteroidota bacterium]